MARRFIQVARTNLRAEGAEAGEEDARRGRVSHALFGPGIPASGGRSDLQQSATTAKTEVNSLKSPTQRAEMQACFACRIRFAHLSRSPRPGTVPGFNEDEPSLVASGLLFGSPGVSLPAGWLAGWLERPRCTGDVWWLEDCRSSAAPLPVTFPVVSSVPHLRTSSVLRRQLTPPPPRSGVSHGRAVKRQEKKISFIVQGQVSEDICSLEGVQLVSLPSKF